MTRKHVLVAVALFATMALIPTCLGEGFIPTNYGTEDSEVGSGIELQAEDVQKPPVVIGPMIRITELTPAYLAQWCPVDNGFVPEVAMQSPFIADDIKSMPTFTFSKSRTLYDVWEIIFPRMEVRSVVPEPATWALMILGLGLVGSALRKRESVLD